MLSIDVHNIEGVKLSRLKTISDSRGSFVKLSPSEVFRDDLSSVAFSINPKVGTIRGLHLQVEPFAEEKIVTCIQGSTFEVIIDLRPNSQTFGQIATFEMSQENKMQVYLPKGIAHGFQTLMPDTIVHYCLTSNYSIESSYSIDPFGDLNIDWPFENYSVSERDMSGVSFALAAQKYAESIKNNS